MQNRILSTYRKIPRIHDRRHGKAWDGIERYFFYKDNFGENAHCSYCAAVVGQTSLFLCSNFNYVCILYQKHIKLKTKKKNHDGDGNDDLAVTKQLERLLWAEQ